MAAQSSAIFFPIVCAGFGLFLAGATCLLLLRRGFAVKLVAVLAAGGIAVGAAAALHQPGALEGTAKFFTLGLLPCLLLSSRRLTGGIATVITAAQHPTVRFGLLTVAGIGTIIGSLVITEAAEERAIDNAMTELESMRGDRASVESELGKAATDQGHPVALKEPDPDHQPVGDLAQIESRFLLNSPTNEHIIRRGPADGRTNCHGWVFTGGKFRVSGEEVELILKENGYQEVVEPQTGDLIVYRRDGILVHTGVVRYVTEGQPVLVESKWGHLGIFLHPADKSTYGTEFTFHRSARTGHLLVGVGGVAPAGGAGATTVTVIE